MDGRTAIRQLLTDAFGDEELRAFCFDYFPEVYERFGSSQVKGDRVQTLFEYCYRVGKLPLLLERLEQKNPAKYAQFVKQRVLQDK